MNRLLDSVHRVFENYLKQRDLKYTPQRRIIVTKLFELNDHIEAESFMSSIYDLGHKISRGTLYSTLKILVESNMVLKIKTKENKVYYEPIYGRKQHNHLICHDCGDIFEFKDELIEKRQKEITIGLGFEIENYAHVLHGNCQRQNCKNKKEENCQ